MSGFIPFEEDRTIAQMKEEGEWPMDWLSTRYMLPYLKRLSTQSITGLEIGTGRGESAYFLLENLGNLFLDTYDPYKEYQDWNGLVPQDVLDTHKNVAKENLSEFSNRCVLYDETFGKKDYYPYIDFVFIDGDHAKKSVLNDLETIYPFIRPGGIIAVHDTNLPEVMEAVTEFRISKKDRVAPKTLPNGVVLWYKP